MSSAWEQLGEDYYGHEFTLIGEVDCSTEEGQPMCDEFEIEVRFLLTIY